MKMISSCFSFYSIILFIITVNQICLSLFILTLRAVTILYQDGDFMQEMFSSNIIILHSFLALHPNPQTSISHKFWVFIRIIIDKGYKGQMMEKILIIEI